jgi:hypothetical protein
MTTQDAYILDPDGRTLMVRLANGQTDTVGALANPDDEPDAVLSILNRAAREQDRRHYTAAARLMADADPYVLWSDPAADDDAERCRHCRAPLAEHVWINAEDCLTDRQTN